MLDDFIRTQRDEIARRARARVASRQAPVATAAELATGVELFVDDLAHALGTARVRASGAPIEARAAEHGDVRSRLADFTVSQVVHDYGDVCQVIMELAIEKGAPVSAHEFQALNLCLDDAIAAAVAAFTIHRDRDREAEGIERLGVLVHEIRNQLASATLAFQMLQRGSVPVGGSTGAVLSRALAGLRDLVDRSLSDIRTRERAGSIRLARVSVRALLEEVEASSVLDAQRRGLALAVDQVAADVHVAADRALLASALTNLLQNAFKFTHAGSRVELSVTVGDEKVVFGVVDACGGLPNGSAERLFAPFFQEGTDQSGLGLGLAITRRAVEACGGTISVVNRPRQGCTFFVTMPRATAEA